MKKQIISFAVLFGLLVCYSCSSTKINSLNKISNNFKTLNEVKPIEIPLSGEASNKNAELSGLCWYGNRLILLPQYPNMFGNNLGKIFYIEEYKLTNFLNGTDTSAILPKYFSINLNDLESYFTFGSGFESITIIEDTAYFTIESMNDGKTETVLIRGRIDSSSNKVDLDKNSMVKDSSSLFLHNISDESILYYNKKIMPIYEVFGKNVNDNPEISVFDNRLRFQSKIKFPSIEYRITDVTSVDNSGRFWAINYFYPGDNEKLNPAKDLLFLKYGIGKSHWNYDPVERLVEFEIKNNEVKLADRAPIYIQLINNKSRNWEGIAKYKNDGFFIATDTFPRTILAFIKAKN